MSSSAPLLYNVWCSKCVKRSAFDISFSNMNSRDSHLALTSHSWDREDKLFVVIPTTAQDWPLL